MTSFKIALEFVRLVTDCHVQVYFGCVGVSVSGSGCGCHTHIKHNATLHNGHSAFKFMDTSHLCVLLFVKVLEQYIPYSISLGKGVGLHFI